MEIEMLPDPNAAQEVPVSGIVPEYKPHDKYAVLAIDTNNKPHKLYCDTQKRCQQFLTILLTYLADDKDVRSVEDICEQMPDETGTPEPDNPTKVTL